MTSSLNNVNYIFLVHNGQTGNGSGVRLQPIKVKQRLYHSVGRRERERWENGGREGDEKKGREGEGRKEGGQSTEMEGREKPERKCW